ncbi:MAG TPA: AAA family ATPase [Candidatus Limnocylindrales bacterium]|jgi:hypothetical protein|nr:AAA family ATPase [Candidatus Limnocylindrales bacterium]
MPAPESVVAAAIAQIEQGFAVFALRADAKVPVTEHGFKNATTRPDWIRRQLEAPAAGNYGLVWPETAPERVVVFDLDDGGGADRPWRDRMLDLVAQHGPLPATKITTTPSGGRHAFYRWPADVPVPAGDELFGFTVRWPGRGYLVGPGSRIGDHEYTAGPVKEIADLPEGWVAAAVAERPVRGQSVDPGVITVAGGFALPDRIPSGRRYAAVRDYVASRYNAGLGTDELWQLVRTQVAPRFEVAKTEAELRADFDRATAKIGERLGAPARAPEARRAVGPGMDAADLLGVDLPPLQWIVPGLIPEGTTILAAPPKVGKSCLVYQIAVEASIGGDLLGRRVMPGSVLYLALEDGKRRGQDRLRAALAGRTMPRGRLEIRWDARNIGEGLEEDIADWLDAHSDAVLVAIDTLGKVRGATDGRRNAYEVDVAAMARLQDLFRDRSVALVIVHHARKESTDDFLTSVSGTYGITGSADTIVVIRRKRNEAFGTLHVTGRDVPDEEITARFDDLTWTAAPGALSAASFERGEVYRVIEARGPVFPKSIADELGMERTSVQHIVAALVAQGAVARVKGGYVAAEVVLDTAEPLSLPLHSTHSMSEERGGGHAPAGTREASPVLRIVPADPTGWAHPCHWYRDHQSMHRQTPSGWTCDACYPEEGPTA